MRMPALRMQNMLEVARKEDHKAISEKRDTSPVPYVAAAAAAAPIVTGFPAQVLAVTPPLFYFYLQTSGIATCNKIKESGTTGDFSPAQFVSLYTNGTVWVIYGALAQDMTVLIPNATAVGFGLYYTSVFAKYHPESMMKWYAGSAAIIAGSAAAATLPNGLDIVGWTGCVMAVILLSSPLAVVGKVIKDKSTAALPFGPSLAGFLNASTWAAYGSLVAMDPYIYAPNGLGMAACAIQLSLFGIYGFPPAASAEEAKPVEDLEPADGEEKPKA
eukprot:CAMPEP_0170170788 /NCGR_PEP_ID=MMETSP0040_2-20121228/3812_1 /TAXON_ID=641309 /ORGANISM="Lotharella oceanica, Strain CCMP622" /LENGTH=272 /DNA_ID=CAMNT_0010410417 /DNA_START=86 /DNA_END=904 /DNA_ORIENTATION=-